MPERSIQIDRNKTYKLFIRKRKLEKFDTKALYLNIDLPDNIFKIGQEIVYNSGEGAFYVSRLGEDSYIEIKALNDFKLISMKSLSLGYIKKESYTNVIYKIFSNTMADSLAFSFVESREDIKEAIKLKEKYKFSLISKIETNQGIENLEEIVNNSNGVMLARGDLCLNAPVEKLGEYQKYLSAQCKSKHREFYIATDFMNSCISNYIPSRSDVIDLLVAISLLPTSIVFNANLVMSSGIKTVIDLLNRINTL